MSAQERDLTARSAMSAIKSFPADLAEFERLSGLASEHDRVSPAHLQLIDFAEGLVQRYPTEADAHHMLGLAWYLYPSSASFRSWRCRRALEHATKIEPDHQYALQYLAYLAFDQERYADALRLHGLLRPGYFMDQDQEWRALKNAEIVLICRMRCEPHHFPEQEFTAFRTWYLDALRRENECGDFGSHVAPQELREYAEWIFESGTQFTDTRLDAILDFIHAISYQNTIRSPLLRSRSERRTL